MRGVIVFLLAVLGALVVSLAMLALFFFFQNSASTALPRGNAQTSAGTFMEFSRTGPNALVIQAVEQVCGKENSQVSLLANGPARRVCIVVQEEQRYYSLDEGWSPHDFPALEKGHFTVPPGPVLQTMSIYRSVAKTALGCRADQGDRIIVLLCPKKEWPDLNLSWPNQ
jgi:hypothetical protein